MSLLKIKEDLNMRRSQLGYGIDEEMDDDNSYTESVDDDEEEDNNLLDILEGFHTSLKNIQDLRQKYDIALNQLNNLDHNEENRKELCHT